MEIVTNRRSALSKGEILEVRMPYATGLPSRSDEFLPPRLVEALERARDLTVWIAGERVNCRALGAMLRATVGSGKLRRLAVERRDNDWDNPHIRIYWGGRDRGEVDDDGSDADESDNFEDDDETFLAEGLRGHTSLEELSIAGFTKRSPLSRLCRALATMPNLKSVSLKADLRSSSPDDWIVAFPPEILRRLLSLEAESFSDRSIGTSNESNGNLSRNASRRKLLNYLCLVGLPPEIPAYTRVFDEAYVLRRCRTHVLIHFDHAECLSHRSMRKPSRYAYFLRDVMLLNQKREEEERRRRLERGPSRKSSKRHMVLFRWGRSVGSAEGERANVGHAASGTFDDGGGVERLYDLASLKGWAEDDVVSLDCVYALIKENPMWMQASHRRERCSEKESRNAIAIGRSLGRKSWMAVRKMSTMVRNDRPLAPTAAPAIGSSR